MDLRWRTVVVTGAGSGLGREVALRFARVGAGVVLVDRDARAAEETAAAVREARVRAWVVQADLTRDDDVELLGARLRDLGGADVLVTRCLTAGLDPDLRLPMRLTQLFLDGLDARRGPRGRPVEPGAVVNVVPSAAPAAVRAGLVRLTTSLAAPDVAARARVTCVVAGRIGLPRAEEQWAALTDDERAALPPLVPPAHVAGVVLDLAARGAAGTVVELPGGTETRVLASGG